MSCENEKEICLTCALDGESALASLFRVIAGLVLLRDTDRIAISSFKSVATRIGVSECRSVRLV